MRVWRDLVGQLDLHNYSRVSAGDKIYNKLGGVIPGRTGTLSTLPKAVGAEFDLTMRYPVIRHALLTGGVMHVFSRADLQPIRAQPPHQIPYNPLSLAR